MRMLLTGASGLVGANFARRAALAGHEVTGVVGRWSAPVPGTAALFVRDLAGAGEAAALVQAIRPDVVINAAAIAEPAACEAAPALSQRLNVGLPAELARAAARSGARCIHLSSEQVFDGKRAPYVPGDAPQPLNLYGRQKLAAEELVLAAHAGAVVLRLPLLLGHSLSTRRSVHERLFELWAAGQSARLYVDEIRQVCSADSVAEVLLGLVEHTELRGLFHWAGAEPVSRYELGLRLARHFGVAPERIVSMQRADTPAVSAQRARDLSMNVDALSHTLGLAPEPLAAAIAALRRPPWAPRI